MRARMRRYMEEASQASQVGLQLGAALEGHALKNLAVASVVWPRKAALFECLAESPLAAGMFARGLAPSLPCLEQVRRARHGMALLDVAALGQPAADGVLIG